MIELATTNDELFGGLPDEVFVSTVAREAPASQSHPPGGRKAEAFQAGRRAAGQSLAHLGCDQSVERAPNGAPIWPGGVVGSISHSRRVSVAAAAHRSSVRALGIDLEDDREVAGIERYVLDRDELATMQSLVGDDRRRYLVAAFSAKEAVYKAVNPRVGRFFGFHALRLEPTGSGWSAQFKEPVDPTLPPRMPFEIGSRWSGDLVFSWLALPAN